MYIAFTLFLYMVFLNLSFVVGLLLVHKKHPRRHQWWRRLYQPVPVVTISVATVTAVFAVLQTMYPSFYYILQRDGSALAAGEWWRLFTPILVQDGGVLVIVFNFIALLALGSVAEHIMRRRSWLLLYFGTGIISELMAYVLLYQNGAGNSLAYFGLATGLLAAGVSSPDKKIKYLSAGGIAVGVSLVLLSDIHGVAFVVGGIIASCVMLWPKHLHKPQ